MASLYAASKKKTLKHPSSSSLSGIVLLLMPIFIHFAAASVAIPQLNSQLTVLSSFILQHL